ncbi:membrane protein [Catenuloplanes niger JCM 9533]
MRKTLLATHVATSVSWLGADLVLLVLGAAVLAGRDPGEVYPAAALIGDVLLLPLTAVIWLVGVANALLTPWGLLRHWWVAGKLVLTTVMLGLVFFLLTPGLREAAAAGAELAGRDRINLVVAPAVSGALLILMIVLSVFKPRGRIGRAGSR